MQTRTRHGISLRPLQSRILARPFTNNVAGGIQARAKHLSLKIPSVHPPAPTNYTITLHSDHRHMFASRTHPLRSFHRANPPTKQSSNQPPTNSQPTNRYQASRILKRKNQESKLSWPSGMCGAPESGGGSSAVLFPSEARPGSHINTINA